MKIFFSKDQNKKFKMIILMPQIAGNKENTQDLQDNIYFLFLTSEW
jgi:hypothetical protein